MLRRRSAPPILVSLLGAITIAWPGTATLVAAAPPLPGVDEPEGEDAAVPVRSRAVEPPDAARLEPARRQPAAAPEQDPTIDAPKPEGPAAAAPTEAPPPRIDGDTTAATVSVAVGLGPDTPGSEAETQIVDSLVRTIPMSVAPPAKVRRLAPGTDPRAACSEGRDDLVITVGYLPDRDPPVLLTHDCGLDVPLGVRAKTAAPNPDLVSVLWREHDDLLAAGYKQKRRSKLNPKVRSALIIGGATVAIGLALGLILANTLRDEVVVLKVSP